MELLWSISDHLRALSLESSGNKSLESAWARLFCKLAELARRSLQTETKQACMHTFTQLLASSSPVLAPHLLATVIQEDYLKVFYLLLGIEAEGHDVFDTS